jgi:hypothetical protein
MNLTRISRKTVFLSYAATAPDGSTTDVDELDLSFLPPYTAPDGATQWHQVTGTNGQIPVLLAGPDADPAGAIAVPETGADAWMKAIEGTEVDATKIARITITGGFADYFDFTTIYGPVPAAGADRAQYFLDAASARLSLKLPGLSDRALDDPNVALIARDIIVQAAIRQFDPARGRVDGRFWPARRHDQARRRLLDVLMHPAFTITVEVHRATRVRFGDVTRQLHHSLDGCFLAPRYANDAGVGRGSVIEGFSLFGPADSDILADDRIKTPDGNFYDVLGEAAEWLNPFTGWRPGFEAALERVT